MVASSLTQHTVLEIKTIVVLNLLVSCVGLSACQAKRTVPTGLSAFSLYAYLDY